MKKFLFVFLLILTCQNLTFAETSEVENSVTLIQDSEIVAEQVFEIRENKVVVNVLKQPLNENSKQKIIMKKNWFVLNIGINGKVKVQPLTSTYEVE